MSQQFVYIILIFVFAAFALMVIRDWWLQRKGKSDARLPEPAPTGSRTAITLPLQLQAYERLALFLERIKPASLIPRLAAHGASVSSLRALLIRHVHTEFEHNLSQQVYVSSEAWEAVGQAKEQLISLINAMAEGLDPEADGTLLSRRLLELSAQETAFPVHLALQVVRDEAHKLLR